MYSFRVRNDIRECLRKEKRAGKKINEVLATHYGERLRPKMKDMSVVKVFIGEKAAEAMQWLQAYEGWSKDHIVEVATRWESGMPETLDVRKLRRMTVRTLATIDVALPRDVALALRERADAGADVGEWILALIARRKRAAQPVTEPENS